MSDTHDVTLRLCADTVSWREVDGEIVALDLVEGDYLAVNATGATLWRALDDGASAAGLVQVLMDRFDIGRDRAVADVDAFTRALDSRGLLRRSTPSP